MSPFSAGFQNGDTPATSVSGASSCTTTATTTSSVGTYPIICAIGTLASDKYDFTFATGMLTIVYKWSGFYQPINDTTYNPTQGASVFKGASTIPVRFQLMNVSGTPVQSSTLPLWLPPQKLSPMSATIGESIYGDSSTSGTTFRWDSASQQYVYNWSTKGFAAGWWYKLSAKLDDGTMGVVTVGVR